MEHEEFSDHVLRDRDDSAKKEIKGEFQPNQLLLTEICRSEGDTGFYGERERNK